MPLPSAKKQQAISANRTRTSTVADQKRITGFAEPTTIRETMEDMITRKITTKASNEIYLLFYLHSGTGDGRAWNFPLVSLLRIQLKTSLFLFTSKVHLHPSNFSHSAVSLIELSSIKCFLQESSTEV